MKVNEPPAAVSPGPWLFELFLPPSLTALRHWTPEMRTFVSPHPHHRDKYKHTPTSPARKPMYEENCRALTKSHNRVHDPNYLLQLVDGVIGPGTWNLELANR